MSQNNENENPNVKRNRESRKRGMDSGKDSNPKRQKLYMEQHRSHPCQIFKNDELYPRDVQFLKDYLETMKFFVPKDYFKYQKDLHATFRKRLFDWIIEVHDKTECRPETLFLAMNIFDKFLTECGNVRRTSLQLIGSCALWIASKYSDVDCLSVLTLAHLASGAFTVNDMIRKEKEFMKVLGFNLQLASSYLFLEYLLLFVQPLLVDFDLVKYVSHYFLEILEFDVDLLTLHKKRKAHIAFYYAVIKCFPNVWGILESQIYTPNENGPFLLESIKDPIFATILTRAISNKTDAIAKKYAHHKRNSVSKMF